MLCITPLPRDLISMYCASGCARSAVLCITPLPRDLISMYCASGCAVWAGPLDMNGHKTSLLCHERFNEACSRGA